MKDERIKKLGSESQNEYIARIYKNKVELGLTNNMCKDVINKELNTQYAESTLRSIAYPFIEAYELGFERGLSERESSDEIEKIKLERLEIEKLKIQYQDQKREYRNLVRPEARFDRILEVMEQKLDEVNERVPFLYNPNKMFLTKGGKEAVLIASDWHIDSVFSHYFGQYDFETAKQRVQELLEKTINYCSKNDVDTLHVELLGDNISGGIHWSSKVNSEEDCVSQTMTLCEILSSFISELCNNISNVKIYSVVGNHSRINMNKKDNQNGENLERLIPFYLKARLVNIPNVEMMEKCNIDDGIIMFDVLNTKIVGVHGDLDRPSQVIDNMIKMLRVFPDEIHMGHLHHHFEKEEYDIEVLINGSLQGTDYYAKDIRKSGRPMQKLMIYDEEGKFCTYKIKLK